MWDKDPNPKTNPNPEPNPYPNPTDWSVWDGGGLCEAEWVGDEVE